MDDELEATTNAFDQTNIAAKRIASLPIPVFPKSSNVSESKPDVLPVVEDDLIPDELFPSIANEELNNLFTQQPPSDIFNVPSCAVENASPFLQYSSAQEPIVQVPREIEPTPLPPPAVQYAVETSTVPLSPPPKLPNPTPVWFTPKPSTSIDDMVVEFLISSPQPEPEIETLSGLEQGVALGRWSQVEAIASELLLDKSKGMFLQLQIKSWLLVALVKQGFYDKARACLHDIGYLEDPKYQFESYPDIYQDKNGSMVPIRLRFIHAILPRYEDSMTTAEDNLIRLVERLEQQSDDLNAKKWIQECQYALLSSFTKRRRFGAAVQLCRQLYDTSGESRIVSGSQLGRLYLEMGNLKAAEAIYTLVQDESAQNRLNFGLLYFAKNEFSRALVEYEAIFNMSDPESDVLLSAVNNLAICSLYCCDVKRAVSSLERLIQKNPAKYIRNVTIFNLCTLYDLACDNPTSTRKKQMLQRITHLYHLEHVVNESHFRV